MKKFDFLSKININLSFRNRMALSYVAIIFIITIVMSLTSLRLASNVVLESSKKIAEKNFNVIYDSLDDYFSNIDSLTTSLIRTTEFQSILNNKNFNSDFKSSADKSLNNAIQQIKSLNSSDNKVTFDNISIFCKNGYSYSYNNANKLPYNSYESCTNYYIAKNFINIDYNSSTWCDVQKTKDITGKTIYSFVNIRTLYDSATFEEIGVLVSSILESDLYNYYSEFSGEAYIVHRNGQVISHSNKALLGESMLDDPVFKIINDSPSNIDTISYKSNNEIQLFTFKKLAQNNALFIVPFNYYNEDGILDNSSFFLPMLLIFIGVLLIAIVFVILLSKSLSSSLLSLKSTVQTVQNGNLNARFSSNKNDEVAYLGKMFNELMEQITKLFTTQKEQERTTHMLELKLMQAQINPHLLYNTLDSTLWALDNKNISHAKTLIISLSEFFKTTLSGGSTLIPLEKELQLVYNYITLQRIAREKKINLKIECDQKYNLIPCPKLSIQPIVENAIIHGFSGFRDDGEILITVSEIRNNTLENSYSR